MNARKDIGRLMRAGPAGTYRSHPPVRPWFEPVGRRLQPAGVPAVVPAICGPIDLSRHGSQTVSPPDPPPGKLNR